MLRECTHFYENVHEDLGAMGNAYILIVGDSIFFKPEVPDRWVEAMHWKIHGQHKLGLISEQNKINKKNKMLGSRVGDTHLRTVE